jgi:predicted 3-demethylubiquinone-9 3-methyltransferase (glyoxalase superfamily)
MPAITPTLWFDDNLEEAATFYASIFPNSSFDGLNGVAGSFVLDGQRFIGINGGPHFHFTEAVSFTINCKDQDEVDFYWDRLTADGGQESQCGWCKDKFGLSWQVVPQRLYDLLSDPDPTRASAATQAMYGMRKIVIADLEEAAASV